MIDRTTLIDFHDTEIRRLRKLEILKGLDVEQIPNEDGLILVSCSDKNRFNDIYGHLNGLCKVPIHTFAWHGGALRLTADSPTNERHPGFNEHALVEIEDAVNVVAKTRTIVLLAHLPCGKARLAGMTWQEVLTNLCKAKFALKARFAERVNVLTVVHSHYWDNEEEVERKRTYFLNPYKWMADQAEISVAVT